MKKDEGTVLEIFGKRIYGWPATITFIILLYSVVGFVYMIAKFLKGF